MNNIENISDFLYLRGYKKTRLREALITYLNFLKKPVSAIEIQVYLKTKKLIVHKTSIYRELQFLQDQQIITEVDFGDGRRRYEIAGLPHHHHLICDKCRSVEDVYIDRDLLAVEKKIERTTSFLVKRHTLEFFGLCQHCLK